MRISKFRAALTAGAIALVASTITAIPAEAANPCGSLGARNAQPTWGYAYVGDDDSTCGVVAIQMRFAAPNSTYTYQFRRQEDPYPGSYYYTPAGSTSPGAWRACSFGEGGAFGSHCKSTQTDWDFSGWRWETSLTRF